MELEYGAEKSNWGDRTRQKLAMFLAPFTFLPFEANDALSAAKIRAYLERQGVIIGAYDIQIAAQGLSRGTSDNFIKKRLTKVPKYSAVQI